MSIQLKRRLLERAKERGTGPELEALLKAAADRLDDLMVRVAELECSIQDAGLRETVH